MSAARLISMEWKRFLGGWKIPSEWSEVTGRRWSHGPCLPPPPPSLSPLHSLTPFIPAPLISPPPPTRSLSQALYVSASGVFRGDLKKVESSGMPLAALRSQVHTSPSPP